MARVHDELSDSVFPTSRRGQIMPVGLSRGFEYTGSARGISCQPGSSGRTKAQPEKRGSRPRAQIRDLCSPRLYVPRPTLVGGSVGPHLLEIPPLESGWDEGVSGVHVNPPVP